MCLLGLWPTVVRAARPLGEVCRGRGPWPHLEYLTPGAAPGYRNVPGCLARDRGRGRIPSWEDACPAHVYNRRRWLPLCFRLHQRASVCLFSFVFATEAWGVLAFKSVCCAGMETPFPAAQAPIFGKTVSLDTRTLEKLALPSDGACMPCSAPNGATNSCDRQRYIYIYIYIDDL